MALVPLFIYCILLGVTSAAAISTSTWEAPLIPVIDGALISPNNYRVYMSEVDLENHFATIGRNLSSCIEFVFDTAPLGYSAFLTQDELSLVRTDLLVEEVEHVYMGGTDSELHEDTIEGLAGINDDNQTAGSNLTLAKRVRQDSTGCNLHYVSENVKNPPGAAYDYVAGAGRNVNIWIVDSGIYTEHNDFGGRAVNTVDYSGDGYIYDGLGHGTHVAAIAAGN